MNVLKLALAGLFLCLISIGAHAQDPEVGPAPWEESVAASAPTPEMAAERNEAISAYASAVAAGQDEVGFLTRVKRVIADPLTLDVTIAKGTLKLNIAEGENISFDDLLNSIEQSIVAEGSVRIMAHARYQYDKDATIIYDENISSSEEEWLLELFQVTVKEAREGRRVWVELITGTIDAVTPF